MRRLLRIVVRTGGALALAAVAVYLPFRPEWDQYRKAVYAEHVTYARPDQVITWEDIRWRLLGYTPAALKPGDEPPVGIEPPVRPGESLVVATLDVEPLTRTDPAFKLTYELRDRAGHRWKAALWHSDIFDGQRNRVRVMACVPRWAPNGYFLIIRKKRPDLEQLIGGRMLSFGP